jgi:hypothetical protein
MQRYLSGIPQNLLCQASVFPAVSGSFSGGHAFPPFLPPKHMSGPLDRRRFRESRYRETGQSAYNTMTMLLVTALSYHYILSRGFKDVKLTRNFSCSSDCRLLSLELHVFLSLLPFRVRLVICNY